MHNGLLGTKQVLKKLVTKIKKIYMWVYSDLGPVQYCKKEKIYMHS